MSERAASYECENFRELGLNCELNGRGITATKPRRQIVSTLPLQQRYLNVLNWRDTLLDVIRCASLHDDLR
ncbi:hypothetical protein [Paraburkholderia sp. J7]|uniref:hypothetical protein n=1 Tax=Paraburkholderia sp. J7 TaxID=2805438 RepID=UPI0039F11E4E